MNEEIKKLAKEIGKIAEEEGIAVIIGTAEGDEVDVAYEVETPKEIHDIWKVIGQVREKWMAMGFIKAFAIKNDIDLSHNGTIMEFVESCYEEEEPEKAKNI